jgi:hypothetical protein
MTSFGDQRDVKIRKLLEDDGYCVGSRRKIPGPGDLLAVKAFPNYLAPIGHHYDVVLIEEHLGTPWRGPGTMIDEPYEPAPQTRRRAKGPRPVPPRSAGPGDVGARAARGWSR